MIDYMGISHQLVRNFQSAGAEELKQRRGLPRQIGSDNGSEFVSRAVDQWVYEQASRATPSNADDRWKTATSRVSTDASAMSA